jgi:hypothetical protein
VLGAVIGVMLIAVGRGKFGRAIPFAPYLAAGAIAVSLFGGPLVDASGELFDRSQSMSDGPLAVDALPVGPRGVVLRP